MPRLTTMRPTCETHEPAGFERKRSDARYCSDTCRAKASKDRARARRESAGRRPRGGAAAPAGEEGPSEPRALTERRAAMEPRLAAAGAAIARADADRAGWTKVRARLQAALARGGDGVGAVSAETISAAVRAEVGPLLAKLAKRLAAVEAEQAGLVSVLRATSAPKAGPTAEDQMRLAKAIGNLNTGVSTIESDLRAFNQAVVEAVGEDE